jgi:acetylglutamate kinase
VLYFQNQKFMISKLLVIKIGGNVLDNPEACQRFLKTLGQLPQQKILIHGGGKIATQVAQKLGIATQMIDGRRITDQPMLDVVTMVYGGLVNKNLVGSLQLLGHNAIGLTGADAAIIKAHKRPLKNGIDYGYVGDIDQVDGLKLNNFLAQNLLPVIAPLSFDTASGGLLNTNADTMASAVAVAMAAYYDVNLIYCFEKKGVLSNPNDDDAVIAELSPSNYATYKEDGTINKGMIPKLDNAFDALQKGVTQVTICHADQLQEAVSGSNAGTKIRL